MRSVKNAGCRYHKNDSCRKIGSLFFMYPADMKPTASFFRTT
ncbi:hypothetical protein BACIT_1946 [Bacillus amyloliquefaciens]|nr:hypothetical protein BACIT_1946 [Bacillus amyloliquefaciens]